jgi:hypothetical protein
MKGKDAVALGLSLSFDPRQNGDISCGLAQREGLVIRRFVKSLEDALHPHPRFSLSRSGELAVEIE